MNRLQQTIAAISLRDLRPRRARSSGALADGLRRSLLLVPLLFACAACALDDDGRTRLQISKRLSYLGSVYGTGGVALGFYLVGRARHDERARETGLLAGEALIDSGIVSGLLKAATARRRPRFHPDTGEFFEGGDSFPSG